MLKVPLTKRHPLYGSTENITSVSLDVRPFISRSTVLAYNSMEY